MLLDWYIVTFDAEKIHRNVAPGQREPWSDFLNWSEIIKVCFEANGGIEPDCIYIYCSTRPESYAIPMEAAGAPELWDEILRRKLFDATLAIEAASATSGLFCWSAPAEKTDQVYIPTFGKSECKPSPPLQTFPVRIIDHAHYQDEDGEYTQGEYSTLEEAQQSCKSIINSELAALHAPGMSAEDLQKQFLLFGQEAYCEGFSGMDYAKLRCAELCSGAST